MDNVWIRGQDNVFIRADSIVVVAQAQDGLHAESISGRTVRLTESESSSAFQLALLQEMRQAGADERWAIVIMAAEDHNEPTWRRERVDTLIDRL